MCQFKNMHTVKNNVLLTYIQDNQKKNNRTYQIKGSNLA